MDIFNKVTELPNFYYQWKTGGDIFGGHSSNNDGTGDTDIILDIWKTLKYYYEQDGEKETLSIDEKIEYAKTVHRMQVYCEGKMITREELKERIDNLSVEDKSEIEWQIEMYERGLRYYGEYIHNKRFLYN